MKLFIALLALSFNSFAASSGDLIKAADYTSSVLNIGSIQQSFLAESSFKKLNGSCWTLVDGKSILGSDYGNFLVSEGLPAVLADMRGTVPRMKDNGRGLNPDGDLALGSYQGDMYGTHTHAQNAHSHVSGLPFQNGWGLANFGTTIIGSGQFINIGPTGNTTQVGHNTNSVAAINQNSGGNETRAKSTTINVFIKINKNCTFP